MPRAKPFEGTMYPYIAVFPEQGERECRTATVPAGEVDQIGLPVGEYAFVELYCVEPGCDCRRVVINVIASSLGEHLATINWGFDATDEMAGPFLDPINRQSSYSKTLLSLFRYVLEDKDYRDRLERHYRQMKEAMADPAHPVHAHRRKIRG